MKEEKIILKTPVKHDVITSLLKKLIFSKLSELQYGQLVVKDMGVEYHFGDAIGNLRADIEIKNPIFYIDLFTKGSIGAAESYMNHHWDSKDINSTMALFAANKNVLSTIDSGLVNLLKPVRFLEYWQQRNTIEGSKKNIVAHYDLPDELFKIFLDPTMLYSSAIYPGAESTLEEAQIHKMKIIADKLDIKPGSKILEIGSGWGAMCIYLALNYDCHVTTTTISENQFQEAQKRIKALNLENKITLLKKDYRELTGEYDRVVSIEMIEAVGHQYLPSYLKVISNHLKADGFALIQAITILDQDYERAVNEVDFIKKFIFPGSFIPSINAIVEKMKENTDMRLVAQADYAQHYAKTLTDWQTNFLQNKHQLSSTKLDEAFHRMWNFYFAYCIGGFRERVIGVSHLVIAKPRYKNI
jgi:cyclopropane-fatty-acyl-phospholipid synthase